MTGKGAKDSLSERNKKQVEERKNADREDEGSRNTPHANGGQDDSETQPVEANVSSGDMSQLILNELRDFRRDNKEQLRDIKEDITKVNKRLDVVETRIVGAEERIQLSEDVMTEMLKLQEQLAERLTDQEGRSRRENIRIYGVTEGAEENATSMISFVEAMLKEKLELPPTTELQIERAHRALASRPREGVPPRSIVVKFLSYRMKEEILRLTRQKKGFLWHEQRVNIDYDYAPDILRKRKEYAEAKRVLKGKNIRFQTPFPARLRVFYQGETKLYDSAAEATKDMEKRGLPVQVIKPPETMIDQIRQLTWSTRGRGGVRGGRTRTEPNYKEKLRTFRREQAEDPHGGTSG